MFPSPALLSDDVWAVGDAAPTGGSEDTATATKDVIVGEPPIPVTSTRPGLLPLCRGELCLEDWERSLWEWPGEVEYTVVLVLKVVVTVAVT